jgi:beta-glucanase (GH16 family)
LVIYGHKKRIYEYIHPLTNEYIRMKKTVLIIAFLLHAFINFSQQMPIGFNYSQDTFIGFQGSNFTAGDDPKNSSNKIGKFYNDGSNSNQGFYLDVAVDTEIQQTITLSFYSFDSNNHNILLKLEDASKPNIQVKETFSTPSSSDWQTITFDLSTAKNSEDNTSLAASGTYSRIAIFIDQGNTTAGTYLIDDISNGAAATDPNAIDITYTDLVWSDEFDTNGEVDDNKWFHQTKIPGGGSWYNGEVQHYTNRTENSYIENGNMHIKAIKEAFTDQGHTKQYTSARLNSKYAFTYGRLDVRAKLPFGNGTWPAIWTLGQNIPENGGYWQTQGYSQSNAGWPICGEIDVMEHGLHETNESSSALHTPSSSGNTVNNAQKMLDDVANEYHIYSMNWSPNQITFLIDEVAFYTYKPAAKNDETWPFNKAQYLLLNVAMGGISGTIDASFTNSSMVIDYVRVYQNTSTASVDEVFNSQFSVSPNPASAFISIKTNELIDKVELYSVLGELTLAEEKSTKYFDTKKVASGLYLMKIYSGDKIATKKILLKK